MRLPAVLSGPQFEQVVAWLQTTVGVLQGAVGSTDFLQRAAESLVEIVGLHSGRVLLKQGKDWDPVAVHGAPRDDPAWRPSDTVLEGVLHEKRTVWERVARSDGADPAAVAQSLWGLQMVVAAPLLDAKGEVIGALYGEQRQDGAGVGREAGKLEAMLVEMLAGGVAAGLRAAAAGAGSRAGTRRCSSNFSRPRWRHGCGRTRTCWMRRPGR